MSSEFVICVECGGKFQRITSQHLKSCCGLTTYEYHEKHPNAPMISDDLKRHFSKTSTEAYSNPALCKELSESISKAYEDPAVHEKISKALMGHEVLDSTKQKIGSGQREAYERDSTLRERHAEGVRKAHKDDPGLSDRMSDSIIEALADPTIREHISQMLMGHEVSEETRQKLADARLYYIPTAETCQQTSETMKKNWKDPDFAARMIMSWNRHPNDSELELGSILETHFPGVFKFVGNSKEGNIDGKVADFIDLLGKKIVIEMFGMHWHDPVYKPERSTEDELVAHYALFGFKCLVFWENVVKYDKALVVQRVSELLKEIENGQ